MTTGSETWTGTTGAGWGSNWIDDDASTASSTIQANAGRQTTDTAAGSYYGARQAWSDGAGGRKSFTDLEVRVDVRYAGSGTFPYSEITFRGDAWFANYDEPQNGYVVAIQFPANSLNINRMVSSSENGVATSSFVYSRNTWYSVRARITGSGTATRVQARIWVQGATEPSTWNVDWTDTGSLSTPINSGFFALSNSSSDASAITEWDNLTWDDLTASGTTYTDNVVVVATGAVTTASSRRGAENVLVPAAGVVSQASAGALSSHTMVTSVVVASETDVKVMAEPSSVALSAAVQVVDQASLTSAVAITSQAVVDELDSGSSSESTQVTGVGSVTTAHSLSMTEGVDVQAQVLVLEQDRWVAADSLIVAAIAQVLETDALLMDEDVQVTVQVVVDAADTKVGSDAVVVLVDVSSAVAVTDQLLATDLLDVIGATSVSSSDSQRQWENPVVLASVSLDAQDLRLLSEFIQVAVEAVTDVSIKLSARDAIEVNSQAGISGSDSLLAASSVLVVATSSVTGFDHLVLADFVGGLVEAIGRLTTFGSAVGSTVRDAAGGPRQVEGR